MTKTCSQCGAVLPSSVRACNFCDSPLSSGISCYEDISASPPPQSPKETNGWKSTQANRSIDSPGDASSVHAQEGQASQWRGELNARMEAYRARKRRRPANTNQSQLPLEYDPAPAARAVALDEPRTPATDDFSFTIAIGRAVQHREKSDGRMEIDVSIPPSRNGNAAQNNVAPRNENAAAEQNDLTETYGLYPVASLEERRFAAAIDIACLLFAYGGFLALFGSLGGQFTVSKLSAAVCGLTFAIVYLQYFALFTIFGGTTPGMMFRGLQVASFTGDAPTPRQMLLRSAGYVISAGTFFLGFFWAWWDEDALTWHDRLSQTYLSVLQTHEDIHSQAVAHSHSR